MSCLRGPCVSLSFRPGASPIKSPPPTLSSAADNQTQVSCGMLFWCGLRVSFVNYAPFAAASPGLASVRRKRRPSGYNRRLLLWKVTGRMWHRQHQPLAPRFLPFLLCLLLCRQPIGSNSEASGVSVPLGTCVEEASRSGCDDWMFDGRHYAGQEDTKKIYKSTARENIDSAKCSEIWTYENIWNVGAGVSSVFTLEVWWESVKALIWFK